MQLVKLVAINKYFKVFYWVSNVFFPYYFVIAYAAYLGYNFLKKNK